MSPAGLPTKKKDLEKCRLMRPRPKPLPSEATDRESELKKIIGSWKDTFSFKEEKCTGDRITEKGLRPPQIGALHAVLAHWTVSHDPATIVMPTGTGKTEVMLALLVAERLNRVLVIVPTDALRDQLTDKFLTLGILKQAGVVASEAQLPIVGMLKRKPKTVEETEAFFDRCNVIVTTAQVAGDYSDAVGKKIALMCSHLFVDEAHHVRAPTWERIRALFAGKPVLQFTATPYRGDGKLVDGKIIYNYPLRKAQSGGYFRPIRFRAIEEYSDEKSDERIAQVAIAQLDEDLAAGHDHLLMARCSGIAQAEHIHGLYFRLAARHNPVIAHSKLKNPVKRQAIEQLRTRTSRIVVCVDMFGEGFDLPELKVAALHAVHKSLAVTLQFTGRFTRIQENVGEATVVANTADVHVEEALQALYGEDPDWNILLRQLSEEATGEQVLRSEFLQGFTQLPEHIPLQSIFPKMSTVVYQTRCAAWRPEQATSMMKKLYDKPALHPEKRILVMVTKEQEPVPWGDIRGISDTIYDLYLLHWDEETKLLYIHSSNKSSAHEGIAKAVCGEDASLIRGENVFRVLHGVNHLILMNLGLGHSLSRAVRFTMYVGSDIREGLSQAHAHNKFKTNLFGRGYANGDKASIGCSAKGRIWSYKIARDMSEWSNWCHETGSKLLDETLNVNDLVEGAMIPTKIPSRPSKIPLTVEWSEDLLGRNEEAVRIELAGVDVPLYEVGIELTENNEEGPIKFRVFSESWPAESAEYEVKFTSDGVEYVSTGTTELQIKTGRNRQPLSEYMQKEPPVIRFHDGAFLIYNELFDAPTGLRSAFSSGRIEAWDWTNVDLKKESQKQEKRPDSIQRSVIEKLLAAGNGEQFDIVFDDDNSGEAADIVAIKAEQDRLVVHLYHCKFSKESFPGARVQDLYAVCGQAQSSVFWKGQVESLIEHLLRREAKRIARGGVSRFERGDNKALKIIRRRLRSLKPEFQIHIVQPGLSKSQANTAQLDLLAVTELYLKETYGVTLAVIASE